MDQCEWIESAEATGPFVNLRYQRPALAECVVRGILANAAPYGPWPSNGKSVVIDYSSPNIAKEFHFGHLRSTVIGAALRRLYKHTGHVVHGINHLGDWGAQFGKVIVAWRRWGDEEALAKDTMRHLSAIYQRFNDELPNDPTLKDEAARAFQRLESGEDNEERALWAKLRQASLDAFAGPYERLGVEFDAITGESFYEDKMADAMGRIQDAGIATCSEGALIVELEGLPAPLMLEKSDGTTTYATRDLAALFYRRDTYHFDKALYVVGGEQRLHFRQLRATLERLGWPEAAGIQHIDFGLVLDWDDAEKRWRKSSSRQGTAIFLDEVLDRAVHRIRQIIAEKNPGLANKDAVAAAIGTSAIVFNDLKNGRIKDVKFDLDEMLNFDGETGPYVQFAGVRLAGILRKAGQDPTSDVDYALLADADEVLLTMLEFGPTLERCIAKNEPSILTQLMVRVAGSIHAYLRDHWVINADPPVKKARLALVAAARRLLASGLGLLGVASPDEM